MLKDHYYNQAESWLLINFWEIHSLCLVNTCNVYSEEQSRLGLSLRKYCAFRPPSGLHRNEEWKFVFLSNMVAIRVLTWHCSLLWAKLKWFSRDYWVMKPFSIYTWYMWIFFLTFEFCDVGSSHDLYLPNFLFLFFLLLKI